MEYQRYYAKINLDAIGKNVQSVRDKIPSGTKICAVIKADAYGHGACALADYLDKKVDWYGVANVDEALELRRHGSEKPILILGTTMPEEFPKVVENGITIALYRLADAEKLSAEAVRQGKTAGVHIKIDTGMSRIGFQVNKASAEEVKKISVLPGIEITGLFSHFAKADETDKSSALGQRKKYDEFVSMLDALGVSIPIKHLNNSAGTMELDKYYDMVRMGIMLYGLYPSDEMDKSYTLYPTMELWSHITHIKLLEAGRGISYGHTFVTDHPVKVATIPVGYADGYPRCLSGKGEVLIRGQRCPILGRVCMDQFMVDVSGVPEAEIGDDVTVVGKNGDDTITIEDVADNAYSFNYEFVCRVSRRVPRVYFENGKYKKTVSYLD